MTGLRMSSRRAFVARCAGLSLAILAAVAGSGSTAADEFYAGKQILVNMFTCLKNYYSYNANLSSTSFLRAKKPTSSGCSWAANPLDEESAARSRKTTSATYRARSHVV
jgi:hypothetical protein